MYQSTQDRALKALKKHAVANAFGIRVAEYRIANNLSHRYIYSVTGVAADTLNTIERGRIKSDALFRLHAVFPIPRLIELAIQDVIDGYKEGVGFSRLKFSLPDSCDNEHAAFLLTTYSICHRKWINRATLSELSGVSMTKLHAILGKKSRKPTFSEFFAIAKALDYPLYMSLFSEIISSTHR